MKNLGRIEDPKDIITKEFLEGGIGARVNTLEDNLQMAESDIDSLQTDVQGLQTDNTATKAAVQTLQDTYVPNTRKVNGKALDADITIDTSFYVNATISEANPTVVTLDKTNQEIVNAYTNNLTVFCIVSYGNRVFSLPLVSTNTLSGLEFISPYVTGVNGELETQQIIIYEELNGWKIRYDKKPTKTSQLTNDSGFLTSAVTSINNKTGAVTLTASDVGALSTSGGEMTGGIDMNAQQIINVPSPRLEYDVANKEYVDIQISDTVDSLKSLIFSPVTASVSAWVTNTNSQATAQEKIDYPFMASLYFSKVTGNDMCQVIYSYDDQISGNFAPCAYTTNNYVIIEAKEKPSATVTLNAIVITRFIQ